ncbi:hypothetical protein BH09BAC1_BH09BAC1_06700 [soil metagenome]
MRYLLLSSLLAVMAWCGCSRVAHLGNITLTIIDDITLFTDTTSAYLYKSKINIYGHYLSGLMLIKPIDRGENYKVAMTTEFGAKILDFEIVARQFVLNDCIEQMRRKRILDLLALDMLILLGQHELMPYVTNEGDSIKLYTFTDQPKSSYAINGKGDILDMIGYKKNKKVVTIKLSDYIADIPKTILLEHHNMPVQIELNLIKAPGYAPE